MAGTLTCIAASLSGSFTSADMNTTGSYRISGTPLAQASVHTLVFKLFGFHRWNAGDSAFKLMDLCASIHSTAWNFDCQHDDEQQWSHHCAIQWCRTRFLSMSEEFPPTSLGFWMSSSNSAVQWD